MVDQDIFLSSITTHQENRSAFCGKGIYSVGDGQFKNKLPVCEGLLSCEKPGPYSFSKSGSFVYAARFHYHWGDFQGHYEEKKKQPSNYIK